MVGNLLFRSERTISPNCDLVRVCDVLETWMLSGFVSSPFSNVCVSKLGLIPETVCSLFVIGSLLDRSSPVPWCCRWWALIYSFIWSFKHPREASFSMICSSFYSFSTSKSCFLMLKLLIAALNFSRMSCIDSGRSFWILPCNLVTFYSDRSSIASEVCSDSSSVCWVTPTSSRSPSLSDSC